MRKIAIAIAIITLLYLFIKNEHVLLLCSGIAIFIFGMMTMSSAFKNISGSALENFLKKSTQTTSKSLGFGIVSTVMVQSSTLIVLLTISFLSAGLIDIIRSLGIVLGAKIGTTTGAWLIAGFGVKVDIARFCLPLVVFGIIFSLQKAKKYSAIGNALIGIGFVFLGVAYIKDGFDALGHNINLMQYSINGFLGIFIFFLIGAIITIITQSSLATITIVIAALSVGQVEYMNALAIVVGANLGTSSTAVFASFGANTNGKRLVLSIVLYDIIRCGIFIIFLKEIAIINDFLAKIIGIHEDNYALKVALFDSMFNITNSFIGAFFIKQLTFIASKILKERKDSFSEYDDALYLTDSAMDYPNAIKEVLHKEIKHLCKNASDIVCYGIFIKPTDLKSNLNAKEIVLLRKDVNDVDFEELYQKRIKQIYAKIINFIIIAQSKETSNEIVKNLSDLQKATLNIIEALKDIKHLQKNLKKYVDSTNINIKNEYNLIREHLINMLRIIEKIFNSNSQEDILFLISKIELESEKFDKEENASLANLIKTQKITATMGTSLMNDSGYIYDVSQKIAISMKLLFANNATKEKTIVENILLENE